MADKQQINVLDNLTDLTENIYCTYIKLLILMYQNPKAFFDFDKFEIMFFNNWDLIDKDLLKSLKFVFKNNDNCCFYSFLKNIVEIEENFSQSLNVVSNKYQELLSVSINDCLYLSKSSFHNLPEDISDKIYHQKVSYFDHIKNDIYVDNGSTLIGKCLLAKDECYKVLNSLFNLYFSFLLQHAESSVVNKLLILAIGIVCLQEYDFDLHLHCLSDCCLIDINEWLLDIDRVFHENGVSGYHLFDDSFKKDVLTMLKNIFAKEKSSC